MIKQVMTAVVLSVACATGAPSYAASRFTADNTVVISAPISGQSMQPVTQKVVDWILKGVKGGEVNIVLSSPGGSVVAGFFFVNKLKALQHKGVKVNCYVEDVAASMAFQILTQCDKRIVLNESFLLWHRVRVNVGGMFGAPMTAPQAHDLMTDLQAYDDHILSDLIRSMGSHAPIDYITYHFERETLHTGKNLCTRVSGFCTAVDVVPGLVEIMADERVVKATVAPSIFGESDIMYIWDKFPVVYTVDTNK